MCVSGIKSQTPWSENMKTVGLTAAILVVALLTICTVSALSASGTLEKTITIKGIGPDTAMTSDGQVVHIIYHTLTNASSVGSVNQPTANVVKIEPAGTGLIKIGSDTYNLRYASQQEVSPMTVSGSVAPGNSDAYGPYSWTEGTQVSVSATWTPTNEDVYLGIVDLVSDEGYASLFSGGSGTVLYIGPLDKRRVGKINHQPDHQYRDRVLHPQLNAR